MKHRIITGAAAAALAGMAQAAVTVSLTGGTLRITSTNGDSIFVAHEAGRVLVNEQDAGAAADVTRIEVQGDPGDNNISLQAVNAVAFPNLTSVSINGGGGSDSIFGSQLADEIIDPDGGDEFLNSPGDDLYIINVTSGGGVTRFADNQGNNTVRLVGTSADEVFVLSKDELEVGSTRVLLDARPGGVIIDGAGGRNTFVALSPLGYNAKVNGTGGDDYLAIDTAGAKVSSAADSVTVSGSTISYSNVATISTCDFGASGTADCNQNRVPDACEIATNATADSNGDGIPDECASADPDDEDDGGSGPGGGSDGGGGGGSGGGNNGGGNNDGGSGGGNGAGGDGNDDGVSDDDDDDNSGGGGGGGSGDDDDDSEDGQSPVDALTPDCAACGIAGLPFAPFIAFGIGGMKMRRRRAVRGR